MKKVLLIAVLVVLQSAAGEFEIIMLPDKTVLQESLSKINPEFVQATNVATRLGGRQMAPLGVDLAVNTCISQYLNTLVNLGTPWFQVKEISNQMSKEKPSFLAVILKDHPAALQKLLESQPQRSKL